MVPPFLSQAQKVPEGRATLPAISRRSSLILDRMYGVEAQADSHRRDITYCSRCIVARCRTFATLNLRLC